MKYEPLDRQFAYKEQDPAYKGQPLDRQLAQGPSEQRRCRDVLCILLYAALWVAMVIIAGIAWSRGDPKLLAAPFDSSGIQCGYGVNAGHDYAYYNSHNLSEFGCVKACPEHSTDTFQVMLGGKSYTNARFPAYETIKIVTLCFPLSDSINQYITTGLGYFDRVINDLKATWKISLISIFASLAFSLVLLAFIRTCGSCMVFIIIGLYLMGLIGLGVGCMVEANNNSEIAEWTNPQNLKIVAYICWAVAGLSILILLCNLRKIRIAAAVIRSAAQFTRQQCKIITVPLAMFLLITVFLVFWILASVYIFSCGEIIKCRTSSPYACINWDVGVKRSLGLFLFGLFWNCELAISICQFIIASTAAYWYFSNNNRSSFPLLKSICRALTLQLGSLIFAGLLLCLTWILQIIFELLEKSVKSHTVSNNAATNTCIDFLLKCARCCLACFERFVRFLTHNAILMMAISGQGFCTSAHHAFYLAMRSAGQYAITHGVGHTLMFFGKLLVSVLVTTLAYWLAVGLQQFEGTTYSPLTPAVMSFIISYVIGTFFMDVFGVASDTILLCYCIELDVLKGMAVACPAQLKETLDTYRR